MNAAALRRAAAGGLCLLLLAGHWAAPALAQTGVREMARDVMDSLGRAPGAQPKQQPARPSGAPATTSTAAPMAPTPPKAPEVPGAKAPAVPSSQAAPLGQAPQPGAQWITLRLDGGERRAALILPRAAKPARKGQSAPKLPAVIFLHGAGGSAQQAMRQTGLAERAQRQGIISVFPEGLGPEGGQTWNAWMCCGYARDQRVDDVGFLSALISRLADYGADPRRIHLAGFSNGAMLASRFVLERPGVAASLTSVAGYLPCDAERPSKPLPVLVIHGNRDGVARYGPTEAHPATGRYCEDYPAKAQVDFWVRGMGLAQKPKVQEAKNSPARIEDYAPAKSGSAGWLRSIVVKGGGHAWPGGPRERYRYCDLPESGVDATGALLGFILRPQRPEPQAEKPAPKAAPAKGQRKAKAGR